MRRFLSSFGLHIPTGTVASGSQSISKGSEEAFLYECDPCKYQNITSEGKTYCMVCSEYLCPKCEISHKGSKLSRDHKLLTGKDIKYVSSKSNLQTVFCDMHKSMTLNTYCNDHEDVICDTCQITDHKKCTTTDLSNQKRHVDIANSLDDAVMYLTDLKLKFEELKESRTTDENRIKTKLSKSLEDMRNARKEINGTFDRLERKLEKEVRETEERIDDAFKDHMTMVDGAVIQISDQIKSLEELRNSDDEDIIFVCSKKATKLKSKYEQTLSTVQQTINQTQIRFRANDLISEIIELTNIGTLEGMSSQRSISWMEMSVADKREIDLDTDYIYGCTFMKSGHLVLICGLDGIILLDADFKVMSKLSGWSWRVAAINENEVLVTQGGDTQLLRVRLFPQMVAMSTIEMDVRCYGVDVFNDEIFVACHDGNGHGEVQVLNMDGKLQRKLGVSNGESLLKWTNSLTVSRDGNKIFISDGYTDKVTCMNQQGLVIYQYADPDLKHPDGLLVDEDGNLLVCGWNSNNINMVGRDGRKVKVWLTKKDGVVDLRCVSYRQKDGCLVVGLHESFLLFNTNLV